MKHFLFLPFFILLVSCAAMDPANVDVELPEAAPQVKVTNYSKALQDLGLMSQIYAVSPVKIQSNPIGDNTGTSGSTGGEIPRDITEMIKSSLNSIGGQITFIPYDPAFIQNQIVTGYSTFDNKLIPDVVISGGITEFDRGLETRGTNTDAGAEASFTNAAGISRMNTVNSMEVRKGLAEKELGIALFGPTFGRKGSIKKVQGRHAAVRLLVEVSMMQIVGKYLNLPYWRLLGEDALPDEVVMSALSQDFYSTSENIRIAKAQEWLFLLGYDVQVNGILDEKTVAALTAFDPTVSAQEPSLSYETYAALFQAVPIQPETLGRRQLLAQAPAQVQPARTQKRAAVSQPAATQAAAAPAPAPEQPAPRTSQTQTSTSSQPAPAASSSSSGGIGRKLSEEDW
ncbi:MAG: hypothetical protein P8X63_14285 [Desulfuromonadaceae bacterium]